MKKIIHRIWNAHKVMDKPGVGIVVLCYRRIRPNKINAGITIEGYPDTTYFIEQVKKSETIAFLRCEDNIELAYVIESIIKRREGTDKPVEWKFYAPN